MTVFVDWLAFAVGSFIGWFIGIKIVDWLWERHW